MYTHVNPSSIKVGFKGSKLYGRVFVTGMCHGIHNVSHKMKKQHLRTCAPGEDSDQPALSHSLVRIFTEHILDKGSEVFHADDKDSNQTVRKRKLN